MMTTISTDDRFARVVSREPHCIECGSTENLRDSEECWDCYDERMHDAEMFARHGGDV